MECKFEEHDNTADFSLEDEPTPMRRRIALEDFVGLHPNFEILTPLTSSLWRYLLSLSGAVFARDSLYLIGGLDFSRV